MRKSTGIHPSVDIQFPWKNPYLRSEALEQVPEGDKQMHNIGLRFAKRFPELLQGRFSIADLKFTSTCKRRCSQSVTAFALGYLTGKGHVTKHKFQPIPLTTFPCDSDLLLRPWDVCPKYVKTVLLNKTTAFEAGKFLKAKFGKTIEKVREKLGLVGRKEVNARLVMYMMSTCFWAIQTDPNYPEGAGWCSLFNEQDINIFEYYGDLYLYYSQGPANPLSIGCFLLKDIFTSIQIMAGKMKGGQKHKVVVQVGHANTEVYLLMVLGVFTGDEKLTADNYEVMKNREFKLGIMSPMSGNVVLVLHKCFYGEFMIQLYVNERLMKLPPCKSKIGCSLREFEVYYKPKIERCKYENLCKI